VVLGDGDVALRVSQQELVLFARDQCIADVLNEAEDIRNMLPVMTVVLEFALFQVQATYLGVILSRSYQR
jgi:hypothetical protein